jgi:hypothetical protein
MKLIFNTIIFSITTFNFLLSESIAPVVRSTKIPIMDGNVIDDEAWSSINPIISFTQKSPDEGQVATEKTAVRIMYSEQMFYVSSYLL